MDVNGKKTVARLKELKNQRVNKKIILKNSGSDVYRNKAPTPSG